MNKNEAKGKDTQIEEVSNQTDNRKEQVKSKVYQVEAKAREAVGVAQTRTKNK